MEGYAKMLHAFITPYDRLFITNSMPTEREHNRDNPEIKSDPTYFRPAWLDNLYLYKESVWDYMMYWFLPTGCVRCSIIRYVILALAIIGIVSIIH